MDLNKLVKNAESVQELRVRYFEITGANFDALTNTVDIQLPLDAEIISGHANVTQVFDAATTDVMDVGDSAVANRYANDVNLKALGRTAIVPTGFITTSTNKVLRLTRVPTGAKTATGKVRICVAYAQLGYGLATED